MRPALRALRRSLSSRVADAERTALAARRLLGRAGVGGIGFAVETCLRECLNNAVRHGNQGRPRRRVQCELAVGWKWIRFCVRDEGAGFPWRERGRRRHAATATSGRGLRIVDLYSRRVRFNRAGNAVTVWFRRPGTRRPLTHED